MNGAEKTTPVAGAVMAKVRVSPVNRMPLPEPGVVSVRVAVPVNWLFSPGLTTVTPAAVSVKALVTVPGDAIAAEQFTTVWLTASPAVWALTVVAVVDWIPATTAPVSGRDGSLGVGDEIQLADRGERHGRGVRERA